MEDFIKYDPNFVPRRIKYDYYLLGSELSIQHLWSTFTQIVNKIEPNEEKRILYKYTVIHIDEYCSIFRIIKEVPEFKKELVVFAVNMTNFNGNCGIAMLSNFLLISSYQEKGYSKFILEKLEEFLYDINFTVLMYTTLDPENSRYESEVKWKKGNHILETSGYNKVFSFVNARSFNKNYIWIKNLRE